MTATRAAVAGAILMIMTGLSGCSRRPDPPPPNVVIILTDDLRHDAVANPDAHELETPNLDRLAEAGVRFTNSFVATSLCSPSRASFLTGCYPHTHGVVDNEIRDPVASLPTFATLMQEAGYETAFIGKWHMLRDATPRPGFDHWVSFVGQGEYYRNTLNVDGAWELATNYITDELTDRAIAFLEREREQPFLLYLSHKAAHNPFGPAPRHENRYADVRFPNRHDPADRLNLKPDWGARTTDRDLENDQRNYHRCLLAVDEGVGRILDVLEQEGILDNTVVIFTGDNGYMFGEHGGLTDKRAAYEPSIRVPLLMRFPGLAEPGGICEELVLNIDLAPTLLHFAGIPVPDAMQGRSWRDCLLGEPGRDAFLYEYFNDEVLYEALRGRGAVPTIVAVRSREWKYVTYPLDPDLPEELYHLKYDPRELYNRIDDPLYRDQVQEMRRLLDELKARTGFRLVVDSIDRS